MFHWPERLKRRGPMPQQEAIDAVMSAEGARVRTGIERDESRILSEQLKGQDFTTLVQNLLEGRKK
jgi:hypothetical protein